MAILSTEEFEKALQADDLNKKTLITDIKDTLSDLKLKYKNKDNEVLKFKSTIKTIGYDKDKYDSLDKFAEEINTIKVKAKSASNTGDVAKALGANTELTNRLTLMETKLQAAEDRATEISKKNSKSTITNKLSEELGSKLKGSKYVINDLIHSKKVKLVDDEVVFVNGEDIVLFKDGISKVLKDNEDLLISGVKPGANSGKSDNNNSGSKPKFTIEQINKMSPEDLKKNIKYIKSLSNKR